MAYAPYGEDYTDSGTTDLNFTGQNQDTVAGMYDFLYREYHPRQGRWISPDPAGLAAVDMTDPQTWNRFAYVTNSPLNRTDPLGLCDRAKRGENGGCGTSGGLGGLAWIMVDGVPTLSDFVSSMAETGAYYTPCTSCSVPNSNGGHYSVTPTAGNAVWMYIYPNGDSVELSTSGAAELGLGDPQNIGSGSPGPVINSLVPGFNYNVRHWVNGALNRLKSTKARTSLVVAVLEQLTTQHTHP